MKWQPSASIKERAVFDIWDRLRRFEPVASYSYKEQQREAELFYLSMQRRGWKFERKQTEGRPVAKEA